MMTLKFQASSKSENQNNNELGTVIKLGKWQQKCVTTPVFRGGGTLALCEGAARVPKVVIGATDDR